MRFADLDAQLVSRLDSTHSVRQCSHFIAVMGSQFAVLHHAYVEVVLLAGYLTCPDAKQI